MSFASGSLVRARGREWVVLPESSEDFLIVRPLGGTTEETAGIHLALEPVEPACFPAPGPDDLGSHVSCRILRDAVRFGFRSSAGPFRSFGRLACQPRPYQLVPLLMALKLDPIRLLIADDVGIGKTIEACLVARELLDRGEVNRLCVLCPPHLAEQWQLELSSKFNIPAELVLSSTARRLERDLRSDQSIFDVHPFVVVSTDFIKSDRRRHDFLRTCPEFVIVDEAHTCTAAAGGRGYSHQRFLLLSQLLSDHDRHLVLVTATPHSGNEGAFRSLLSLLDPGFAELPEDLSGLENKRHRQRLAAHLVQRRRADLRHYLQRDTPFPERKDLETHYELSPAYKALFDKVLAYARETVADTSGSYLRQRVRWWSALSLLRALASSPAAAAATLRERSRVSEAADETAADELGRKAILDATEELGEESGDVAPGADPEVEEGETANRRRLLAYAREADKLRGAEDSKLQTLVPYLKRLLEEGYNPIVFCRFIQTAEYVAEELESHLRKKATVACITSRLAPPERAARIEELDEAKDTRRVLVCTDCLSEGINLQERFDAVVQYDLSWNPTRHEQRDGRVDRYGQKSKEIRILTYYGIDNQIDGIVLDILLKKHITIRKDLGISVPMPVDSEQIVKAIFEGLLLRKKAGADLYGGKTLFGDDFFRPQREQLHEDWQNAADKEKRSRTLFAQESIKFEEVAAELAAAENAIGSPQDVGNFVRGSLALSGATVSAGPVAEIDLAGTHPGLKDALGGAASLRVCFEPLLLKNVTYLHRTHPLVESLAGHVLTSALDREIGGIARRAGVIRTQAVSERTALLLLRLRFHLVTTVKGTERHLLAEDSIVAAFTGLPESPCHLDETTTDKLLAAKPEGNVPPDLARTQLGQILSGVESLHGRLAELAGRRGEKLLEDHRRVREASAARGRYRIEPSPPDILGIYIYLPALRLE